MKSLSMNWSCQKKVEARDETIIQPFRQRMGGLAARRQYWTMCGKCFDDDGSPLANCELDQVTRSGLINPSQFNGVDIDEGVIAGNSLAWPNVRWVRGDFYYTMLSSTSSGLFDPGIVNFDSPFRANRAVEGLGKIMLFLNDYAKGDLMLVANVVSETRYFGYKADVISTLSKCKYFRWAWSHADWEFYKEALYEYPGSGSNDLTTMSSLVFFRWNERRKS
jgi:hypothetical protein